MAIVCFELDVIVLLSLICVSVLYYSTGRFDWDKTRVITRDSTETHALSRVNGSLGETCVAEITPCYLLFCTRKFTQFTGKTQGDNACSRKYLLVITSVTCPNQNDQYCTLYMYRYIVYKLSTCML